MKRQIEPLSAADDPRVQATARTFTGSDPASTNYHKVEEEIYRVPKAQYMSVNIDIGFVLSQIVKYEPKVMLFRKEMEDLSGFEHRCLTRLASYAMAALFIHNKILVLPKEVGDSGPLAQKLAVTRNVFLTDAKSLSNHQLLDDSGLVNLRRTTGHNNIGLDVLALCEMFRSEWPHIEHKTGITRDKLDRASEEATLLLDAVARKAEVDQKREIYSLIRQAAFTLVMHAWNQVRRAMAYLRWDTGDVNDFAPSLYSGRSAPKGATKEVTATATASAADTSASSATTSQTAPALQKPGQVNLIRLQETTFLVPSTRTVADDCPVWLNSS